MCGIAGQINLRSRQVLMEDLERMTSAITHRGPDDVGFFLKDHVGIGFRRLSIIDIAGGHQPIYNEDASVVIATNGEIYNFKGLRDELVSRGHKFRTKSDVEVALHLYEEHGLDFARHLNGMFAVCIYDIKKDILILARDRAGIKPLYIHENRDVFFFASEIKGIIASEAALREKEDGVLEEFLLFRFLADDRTFFKGIRSLGPGEICVVERGKVRTARYCDDDVKPVDMTDPELVDRIHAYLSASVEMQLVSDAPLGTLLSGGMDSSLVTALSTLKKPGIKSFTVGFEEKAYDETGYARIVSERFKTEYHEIKVGNLEFSDTLEKAVWFYDEPLNHANSVHIYLISRYAAKHVKVLLTGEGADELFGGYPRYYISKLGFMCDSIGPGFKKKAAGALSYSSSRKIRKIAGLFRYPPEEMLVMNSAFIESPYGGDLSLSLDSAIEGRMRVAKGIKSDTEDHLNRLLLFEQKTYLQSILARADKMSMAASIEARVPFLDNEMLAFANSIPGRRKIRNFKAKYLLGKAAGKMLPPEIINRKKVGFGTPIEPWLRSQRGLGRYLDQVLENAYLTDKLTRGRLENMVAAHRAGTANHAEILWPLINYVIWDDTFFGHAR